MSIKKRILAGIFSFTSLTAIGTSSYSAVYKDYEETLIMDNDAPAGAEYRNPASTDGWSSYYPKKCWGMNIYLTGSAHYNNDARKGLCTQHVPWMEGFKGGTSYAWEWTGKDNTVNGDTVTLYVKINDNSFTAPAVEYIHYGGDAYSGGQSFGFINQGSWPGKLSKLSTHTLVNPSRGPYIIASGLSSNNLGHYMGADQIKYVHTYTRYVSTK